VWGCGNKSGRRDNDVDALWNMDIDQYYPAYPYPDEEDEANEESAADVAAPVPPPTTPSLPAARPVGFTTKVPMEVALRNVAHLFREG
jgi:hypothetical protein